jgi:hypothetical protein
MRLAAGKRDCDTGSASSSELESEPEDEDVDVDPLLGGGDLGPGCAGDSGLDGSLS